MKNDVKTIFGLVVLVLGVSLTAVSMYDLKKIIRHRRQQKMLNEINDNLNKLQDLFGLKDDSNIQA